MNSICTTGILLESETFFKHNWFDLLVCDMFKVGTLAITRFIRHTCC